MSKRRWMPGAVASVLIAGIATLLPAGPASAATPPWEPDPNLLGGVTFYDSSGNVLTGGGDLSHIADYLAATTPGTDGATKANLIFANPAPGVNPATWYVATGSASKDYPDASAPAPIKGPGFTNPVVSLSAADDEGDLASFIGGAAANTEPGYQNMYQIRIKDSGPGGVGSGTKYWESDISVDPDAGTWSLVWTGTATKHNTSLNISKSVTIKYGSSTTTSTTLRDTTSSQVIGKATVTLWSRPNTSKPWSKVATATTNATTGKASKTVSPKAHALYQWRYGGDGAHKSATSPTQTVSVTQVVSAHSTKSSVKKGTSFKIWGTVNPPSSGQKANLQRLAGTTWKPVATVTIKKQKLPNGKTSVGFVFTVKPSTTGTFKYRVHKAATSTLLAGDSSTLAVKVT